MSYVQLPIMILKILLFIFKIREINMTDRIFPGHLLVFLFDLYLWRRGILLNITMSYRQK